MSCARWETVTSGLDARVITRAATSGSIEMFEVFDRIHSATGPMCFRRSTAVAMFQSSALSRPTGDAPASQSPLSDIIGTRPGLLESRQSGEWPITIRMMPIGYLNVHAPAWHFPYDL